MLSSADFEDLVSRVSLVSDLLNGDKDLVGQLQTTRDQVRREKQVIAQKEGAVHKAVSDLRQQNEQLAALRAAQAQQQQNALAARQQKQGALAGVSHHLKLLAQQEDELLAQSRRSRISSTASRAAGTAPALVWPAAAGRRHLAIRLAHAPHPGHAPLPHGHRHRRRLWRLHRRRRRGKVIYATGMSGYGNSTIVDHGGGISTLYAHQAGIAVAFGATVRSGQIMGYVGCTGFSTGPHLHFEVRVNGSPVDPMGYLP